MYLTLEFYVDQIIENPKIERLDPSWGVTLENCLNPIIEYLKTHICLQTGVKKFQPIQQKCNTFEKMSAEDTLESWGD